MRLSLEAGWSLISLWRIYDHVMKFDQSESPSSQQGIDAPCNYQRGKREENDGGGGAWSARYSLDIHYTVQKSFDLQYSIIETSFFHSIRSVLWSSWPKICKKTMVTTESKNVSRFYFSFVSLNSLTIPYLRIIQIQWFQRQCIWKEINVSRRANVWSGVSTIFNFRSKMVRLIHTVRQSKSKTDHELVSWSNSQCNYCNCLKMKIFHNRNI